MNQKRDTIELRQRTRVVKDVMKYAGHNQIIPIYKFLYQSSDEKHLTKVQNVLQLKVTDRVIVERLEDLAHQVQ